MIGTLVAASWLTTSGISSVALGRFRFSVIAKYTAPVHLVSLCLAALCLSWQSIAYLLVINLGIAFAASHAFGQFKDDSSVELPDLKNQLEALKEGPPYNFLCGRFYPKQSIAPLAAVAHAIDLVWRHLNQRPGPDTDAEVEKLKARAEATYNRLHAIRITDEKVLPEEKELLYWVTHISPIDSRYALEAKTALLHVRLILGEPLPTGDLSELEKISITKGDVKVSLSEPPVFPEIKAWVFVYNQEPALEIGHLAKAFEELWSKAKARKILFVLMRDYGLCPDKHPKTHVPGLESIYATSAPANHYLPRLTGTEGGPASGWRIKEEGAGLAYQIQSEYILPKELFARRNNLPEINPQSSTYISPIEDRMDWLGILRSFQKGQVIPTIDWDKDFVVIGTIPDLCNPFFSSRYIEQKHKHLAQEEWRKVVIEALLKDLNPFDGHGTTLWRLFLLHHLSKKTEECKALQHLCEEPNIPTCWRFAHAEGTRLPPGLHGCYPIYRRWRPQVQELVRAVKRTYGLSDNARALHGIAKAFYIEWEDRSSPLRSIAFIKQWPVSWWLKVIERSLKKLANQTHDRGEFLQLCAP